MKKVEIEGKLNTSIIYVGEKIDNVWKYIKNKNTVVLIDSKFYNIYKKRLNFDKIIKIDSEERKKNLKTVTRIVKKLIDFQVDRKTFILGIGGGVITDLTGFIGSVFMRGVDFGFITTTLLGQVDAALGGKNGVNYDGYKNIIGTFNQPDFGISDINVLKTLSEEHIINGIAEVIKYGLIYDSEFFDFIEKNYDEILELNKDIIEHIVYKSSKIKADVVNEDEEEKNIRKILNFGHTFGHAIEREYGLLHGKAVSIGMIISIKLSNKLDYISEKKYQRIIKLFDLLKLPQSIDFDEEKIFENLKKDKKKEDDGIKFILLKDIGKSVIKNYSFDELRNLYKQITW